MVALYSGGLTHLLQAQSSHLFLPPGWHGACKYSNHVTDYKNYYNLNINKFTTMKQVIKLLAKWLITHCLITQLLLLQCDLAPSIRYGPKDIKLFPCSTQLSMNLYLLINSKLLVQYSCFLVQFSRV